MTRKITIEVEVPEGLREEEVKRILNPIIKDILELMEWEELVKGRNVEDQEIEELVRSINRRAWERLKEEHGWS